MLKGGEELSKKQAITEANRRWKMLSAIEK
eukprot:SAG31_NODE_10450_length_1137_cov_0.811175_2_plen_29_part_01